ncbi:dTMP kinase [Clostridium formicaceticum]|uniref:Thymidylate kinase n=1 Tax=Clostridium formicaceticum TaxID=1497 RepID=A0AAC9RK87_9CLOT|nr:dTMP kinase [Clostridium formicaceticum]AOY75473.1 dTMP kinase [Clostridium formicaceticum]ARE85760.1 Thymidylate kinase [Clostridium formicaceticum]
MKKGLFISIEGLDGAGKSTQMQFMKSFFQEKGLEVLITREPGGTIIGEKVRSIILDKQHEEMASTTEALLYAASRAQHVTQVILPALKEGKVVLCDRFVDSSIAYQGVGRQLGYHVIKTINDFATQGLSPDLTIFFDIPPEVTLQRINREEVDRLEQEKIDFHRAVYDAYIDLAKQDSARIKVIKADRAIDGIKKDVEKLLIKIIGEGIL